jgi:hypothetical protein
MGQFHRGVVTTYALEVGVAADCDNRHQSLTAILATRCSIHEMDPPGYSSLTRNGNLCSRTLRPNGHLHFSSSGCTQTRGERAFDSSRKYARTGLIRSD